MNCKLFLVATGNREGGNNQYWHNPALFLSSTDLWWHQLEEERARAEGNCMNYKLFWCLRARAARQMCCLLLRIVAGMAVPPGSLLQPLAQAGHMRWEADVTRTPRSVSGGGCFQCWCCPGDPAQGQQRQAPCQTLLPSEVELSDFSLSINFRDDALLARYDTTQWVGVLLPLFAAVESPHPLHALFLTWNETRISLKLYLLLS